MNVESRLAVSNRILSFACLLVVQVGEMGGGVAKRTGGLKDTKKSREKNVYCTRNSEHYERPRNAIKQSIMDILYRAIRF